MDIAVHKSLKDYIKNKSEEEKINQIKFIDIDDDIYLKAPNRSDIILEVCDFCERDKTGRNGFSRIGFFENTLLINSLDNEYVFESVRKFNLPRTYNNKKVLNIGLALHEIISDNIIFTSDQNIVNENIRSKKDLINFFQRSENSIHKLLKLTNLLQLLMMMRKLYYTIMLMFSSSNYYTNYIIV